MKRVNRRNNKDKSLLTEAYTNMYREAKTEEEKKTSAEREREREAHIRAYGDKQGTIDNTDPNALPGEGYGLHGQRPIPKVEEGMDEPNLGHDGFEIGGEENQEVKKKNLEEDITDEISGERWSEEGDQFEPGAEDVAGYIQIDLYNGSVQTIRPEEVGPAVEGLDKVGPDTGDSDWNAWKGEEYMIAAIPK
tara:strand:- start:91 stop:666 length:576 start_codon:yes stop_codon:yes gene_type:complete